jgi:hypothetical protein
MPFLIRTIFQESSATKGKGDNVAHITASASLDLPTEDPAVMVKSTARTADESAHNPAGCPAGAAEPAEHNHLETMRCGVTRVQYRLCYQLTRPSRDHFGSATWFGCTS